MNKNAYSEMSFNQNNHWWYRGRRVILQYLVSQFASGSTRSVLEIGCGTGGNIEFLSSFGELTAIDFEELAIETCRRNHVIDSDKIQFIHMNAEDMDLHFSDKTFDLICMFDVLEHLDDDGETLRKLKKLMSTTSKIIATVPAYQWLWSSHDEYLHHKRRYTRSQLDALAIECGYSVVGSGYFNTFLFPIAVINRIFSRFKGKKTDAMVQVPNSLLNFLLFHIFKFEKRFISSIRFRFGLSVWVVLENPHSGHN